MDWPTAATISSITLGVLGASVRIWTAQRSSFNDKSMNDKNNGKKSVDLRLVIGRIQRLEQQMDLLLKEMMAIMKD